MKARVSIQLTEDQLAKLQPLAYEQQTLLDDDRYVVLGQIYFVSNGVLDDKVHFQIFKNEAAQKLRDVIVPAPAGEAKAE